MDVKEIKETYYKRFGTSDKFLRYTFTGALCTLLGHAEIQNAPFVSCTLSMGVGMLTRRLGGNTVKIQAADSDKLFSYTPPAPPRIFKGSEREIAELVLSMEKYNISGAEIFHKSSIPDFLPQKTEFNLTLVKSLMEAGGIDSEPIEIAAMAARDNPISPYTAAAFSKSGYCTFISENAPKSYPLPLTGYKIVSAHCTENDRDRRAKIQAAYERIREKYPPVGSISDITRGHIACVKDKTAANYLHHLSDENIRISAALQGLKKCDINALFRAMNASQRSMEKYWGLGSEHIFLARCAISTQGVKAVRCHASGITAIIEDDFVDYAVNMIRLDFENNMGYQPTFCVSETA